MASLNSVKVLETTRVAPSSNSPNWTTEFSLPLTFFDLFWLKHSPVERIFFYHFTESTRSFFDSVILPRLIHSLSITLLHYLPLAGHLTWAPHDPKPTILYTPNDAVSLKVAESTSDLTSLIINEAREATKSHALVPELSVSDHTASVISLQVTVFPNQGFCIGITAHHAVLDGKTATMFLKAWAYTCKENLSLPQELIPLFDRTVIKDPTGRETVYLSRFSADPEKRNLKLLKDTEGDDDINSLVRATFELTHQDIRKLRERVLQNVVVKQNSKSLHLSTFVLTCGYVFLCMVKTKCGDHSDKDVCFGFPADYRTRLDPPVPLNYFGNCIGLHLFVAKAEDFMGGNNGFVVAAEKVSDVVKGLEKGVFEGEKEKYAMFRRLRPGALVVKVAGSTRFGVYGLDFGWGRPRKVELVSIDKSGAISMADSRDGSGGVEVGVVLRRHEMETFGSFFVDELKVLN